MNCKQLAQERGHKDEVIAHYEQLGDAMLPYDNNHVSELDTIYFLPNILWGTHFDLVAQILKEYGYADRLRQWQEAYAKLTNQNRIIAIQRISNNVHEVSLGVNYCTYKITMSRGSQYFAKMSEEGSYAIASSLGIDIQIPIGEAIQ